MPTNHRLPMVARELLREIASLVSLGLNDPRIKLVTITKVEPAKDMKTAKVYYSMIGTEKEQELAQRGLSDARNFVRAQLRARLKSLRYIPELMFRFDASIQGSVKISKLIDEAAKQSAEFAEREAARLAAEAEQGGGDGGEKETK